MWHIHVALLHPHQQLLLTRHDPPPLGQQLGRHAVLVGGVAAADAVPFIKDDPLEVHLRCSRGILLFRVAVHAAARRDAGQAASIMQLTCTSHLPAHLQEPAGGSVAPLIRERLERGQNLQSS